MKLNAAFRRINGKYLAILEQVASVLHHDVVINISYYWGNDNNNDVMSIFSMSKNTYLIVLSHVVHFHFSIIILRKSFH